MYRKLTTSLIAFSFVIAFIGMPVTADALVPSENGISADNVLGQADTVTGVSHTAASDTGFNGPTDGTVDDDGNRWIVDSVNNRILRFPADTSVADLALGALNGDPTSTRTGSIGDAASDTLLETPVSADVVSFSETEVLAVADQANHRVALYVNPGSEGSDTRIDHAIGQPDLTTSTMNQPISDGNPAARDTAASINSPNGVSIVDGADLGLSDTIILGVTDSNNRALQFNLAKSELGGTLNDTDAVNEFPRPWDPNQDTGGLPRRAAGADTTLDAPLGHMIALSSQTGGANGLFIADSNNNRIAGIDLDSNTDAIVKVFGDTDLTADNTDFSVISDTLAIQNPQDVHVQDEELAASSSDSNIVKFFSTAVPSGDAATETDVASVIGDTDFNFDNGTITNTTGNSLSMPQGLFSGSFYVADNGNHRVSSFEGLIGGGGGGDDDSTCLIERTGAPTSVLEAFRGMRDAMMDSALGRSITEAYYGAGK